MFLTSLNSSDRSQRQNSAVATMIFTCHTRRFAELQQPVVATCRSDLAHRVSRPLAETPLQTSFLGTELIIFNIFSSGERRDLVLWNDPSFRFP